MQDRHAIRFTFVEKTNMDEVEDTVALALLAVGCLIGDAAVRLGTGYALSPDKRTVVLDVETEAGAMTARVFCGMASHEYGNNSFRTERIDGPPPKKEATP